MYLKKQLSRAESLDHAIKLKNAQLRKTHHDNSLKFAQNAFAQNAIRSFDHATW